MPITAGGKKRGVTSGTNRRGVIPVEPVACLTCTWRFLVRAETSPPCPRCGGLVLAAVVASEKAEAPVKPARKKRR